MSQIEWIRSHVERLLQDEWDVCRVAKDCDGDVAYRRGTAACWISVLDSEPVLVRVFAHAAFGVKPSLKMFKELNDIQRRALSVSIGFEEGLVIVSQPVNPIGLTGPVLAQAVEAVGCVADDIGVLLAGMFGGATPFEATVESDEEVS